MEYLTKDLVLPASRRRAVIREANAFSEQLVFESDKDTIDALIDFWSSLLISLDGGKEKPDRKQFIELVEPDRIFLGIEIYKLSISDTLVLTSTCDKCGEPANYSVDLNSLDLIPLPPDMDEKSLTFTVTLPRTGHVVVLGYRTGEDELEEMNTKGFNPSRMAWKAIRSVDGSSDIKLSQVMEWPLADHVALRKAIIDHQCGYDTRVKFTHKCGKKMVVNLLADPSFLTPGLAF